MTIKTEQFEASPIEPLYIERYYDSHLKEIEGNELSQLPIHALVIEYLIDVLRWLWNNQAIGVINEINLYYSADPNEMPRSPDVTAIDDYDPRRHLNRSYTMYPPFFPAPRLAIEVASEKTWEIDFDKKFNSYQAMGIQEYFIFDPGENHNWNKDWQQRAGGTGRLIGWKLNANKQFERLPLVNTDRIWSIQADSWLVVEGQYLRLYDVQGKLRLTETEYERERAERFAAKLRELNINPEDLLD